MMTKKIIILLIILILCFLPNVGLAVFDINIDIKDSFSTGEVAIFNYSIHSDTSQKVIFIPYIDCPSAPLPTLEQKIIELKARKAYTGTYGSVVIDELVEPQTCVASVQILGPPSKKVEKEFKIVTKPSFDLWVFSCKDRGCEQKSKVFVRGKMAYFDYSSDVAGVKVRGEIDGKEITLPESIVLGKAGKHTLEVEAKKEDYKTQKQKVEIVVLEGNPKITDAEVCNENGICERDKGETEENCAADCVVAPREKPKEEEEEEGSPLKELPSWLYYIGGAIIVLLIIFITLKLRRKKVKIVHYE